MAAVIEPVILPMPPSDHRQDVERFHEGERRRMGDVEVMGEQAAGHAGERSADRERQHLVFCRVHAHGLRGDFVLADRNAGPAVAGVDEILDEEKS